MRAVVQRVSEAGVSTGDRVVGKIDRGMLVLVGIAPSDGEREVAWLADKLANLRIFEDDDGKMNRSVLDTGGAILLVSQFTLYGDARRGRRPSFIHAAQGPEAETIYDGCVAALRALGVPTETGAFGELMEVALVNSGPTTILLDSDKTF